MSSVMELDQTLTHRRSKPETYALPEHDAGIVTPLQPVARPLEPLLNNDLPAAVRAAVRLESARATAGHIDGEIIGTGEADFTKGNNFYTLNYNGKTFQLVDVPGIEGDEGKYAHLVRKAVARAHLVFYVNGTNKKPEKATIEKIRSYLRRGTHVMPIVNVRGSADAYEFEEDRQSLEKQGESGKALAQTVVELEKALSKETLLPGRCVQGLLAFSALAIQPGSRKTSIHPSRSANLAVQQRNYLKWFGSPKAMYDFSQLQGIALALHDKLGTFREDIVESNKVKVRELLAENVKILQAALKEHQDFIARVRPEFEKCRASIDGAVQTFERLMTAGRANLWNDFFNTLSAQADDIVADNFGEDDRISAKLKKAFQMQQEAMGQRLQEQCEECLAELQIDLRQAMTRLAEDVQRIHFIKGFGLDDGVRPAGQFDAGLDMDLGLKDWGAIAFKVGSYALSGATIGSGFPIIGTAIGAIAGAVVGILMSVVDWFTSKEKRIRKAQAQVQEKIDEVRDDVLGKLPNEIKNLMKQVRKDVKETALDRVDAMFATLCSPLDIIQMQVALMTDIRNQLENMPHGTIQAIRR